MKPRTLPVFLILTTLAAPRLSAEGCGNIVNGTFGDDVIDATFDPPTTPCDDFVFARTGDDVVHALGGDDHVNGGNGDDALHGDDGRDAVDGESGDDLVHGGNGDDALEGGSNDDRVYGDDGDDEITGGSGNDYLEGGAGRNRVDGQGDDDLLVGRSQRDTLIGGSGDDFLVVVGSSLSGYQLNGDATGSREFDDLLFFARDAHPEMVSEITVAGRTYRQLSFDLRTDLPVDVDLAQAPRVEAVATGNGDDRLRGTDASSHHAYAARFLHSGTPLRVHELFFAGPGDDRVETREGDDYVDAGPGDDTVVLGSGAGHLVTGPGRDTLEWPAAALGSASETTVADFAVGDRIRLLGSIRPEDVSLAESLENRRPVTRVLLKGTPKIRLRGVRRNDVRVQRLPEARGGVEIRVTASVSPTGLESPRLFSDRAGGGPLRHGAGRAAADRRILGDSRRLWCGRPGCTLRPQAGRLHPDVEPQSRPRTGPVSKDRAGCLDPWTSLRGVRRPLSMRPWAISRVLPRTIFGHAGLVSTGGRIHKWPDVSRLRST